MLLKMYHLVHFITSWKIKFGENLPHKVKFPIQAQKAPCPFSLLGTFVGTRGCSTGLLVLADAAAVQTREINKRTFPIH